MFIIKPETNTIALKRVSCRMVCPICSFVLHLFNNNGGNTKTFFIDQKSVFAIKKLLLHLLKQVYQLATATSCVYKSWEKS